MIKFVYHIAPNMSRRSLVTSRRGRFTAGTCFLLPIPAAVFRSMKTVKTRNRLMTIVVSMFVCFLSTFASYVIVFCLILRL